MEQVRELGKKLANCPLNSRQEAKPWGWEWGFNKGAEKTGHPPAQE